jgi:hypothetical protein
MVIGTLKEVAEQIGTLKQAAETGGRTSCYNVHKGIES